jgi:AraC-like DNA-binding protein
MEDTNHTLDVVAQETGFEDRNQMRRAFLRAYGQPPQVIRRQSRGYASIKESELAEPKPSHHVEFLCSIASNSNIAS